MDDGTCPGYLISLAKVHQAARVVPWYRTGQLEVRLGGCAATPLLCDAIDLLEAEQSAVDAYSLEHPDDGRS